MHFCVLPFISYFVFYKDCSSGAAERNWNAHALAHTKNRNRLKLAQLERLVYVRENLRLVRKFEIVNASPMHVLFYSLFIIYIPQISLVLVSSYCHRHISL